MQLLDITLVILSSLFAIAGTFYLSKRRAVRGSAIQEKLGVRVVCISDTHADHEKLSASFPSGDILIHAGDFTRLGRFGDVDKFNTWLGEIKSKCGFQYAIVVNGNHENNAPWQKSISAMLTHATFLKNSDTTLRVRSTLEERVVELRVHGTDFYWPMKTPNPFYELIAAGTDILISHEPCQGKADGGRGCAMLLAAARRVAPKLVVSGHIHSAHGVAVEGNTTFVNAASCRGDEGYLVGWQPVVVDL